MTGNGNSYEDSTALTPVNPIVGRSVAHNNHLTQVQRAFLGADWVREERQLIRPTVTQALVMRVSTAYVHAALKQSQSDRFLIEAGAKPLTSPAIKLLPAPVATASAESRMASIIRDVGIKNAQDLLSDLGMLMAIETMEQEQLAAAV
jgi:hypothetical protein